jgi:DNA-binding MarR family transcriptional regulator
MAQHSILAFLRDQPEMSMSELAQALSMDRTTLVRALKPLTSADFVTSVPFATRPRQLAMSLTASGREKLKEALPYWRAAQAELEANVGAEKAARLRSDLTRLCADE